MGTSVSRPCVRCGMGGKDRFHATDLKGSDIVFVNPEDASPVCVPEEEFVLCLGEEKEPGLVRAGKIRGKNCAREIRFDHEDAEGLGKEDHVDKKYQEKGGHEDPLETQSSGRPPRSDEKNGEHGREDDALEKPKFEFPGVPTQEGGGDGFIRYGLPGFLGGKKDAFYGEGFKKSVDAVFRAQEKDEEKEGIDKNTGGEMPPLGREARRSRAVSQMREKGPQVARKEMHVQTRKAARVRMERGRTTFSVTRARR